ncbi:CatB-related O-acetyltransferase [Tenacibaculum sp. 190524A05c]|uniref:CatB-related O-acetyltransferase n=1 Tax=Tenacibaculum platacis TaxID=3137852 RepID=UPI0031FACDDA
MKPLKFLFYNKKSNISKSVKVYPLTKVMHSDVDDYTYISYNCTINNCEIGKYCSIASGVKIGMGIHPVNFISTSPIFYSPYNPLRKKLTNKLLFKDREKVIIGNDVWIGTNVTVLDGVTIGNGAIIGANSVVTKDVNPYEIVGGVPARFIKKRFEDDIIENIQKSKWWDLPIEVLKSEEVLDIFSKEISHESIKNLQKIIKKRNA